MGTEITKVGTPGTLAIPTELQGLVEEFGTAGFEGATQADRATPFISLIQGLSPQIDKSKPQYIRGAETGDIFNTATGELYKTEVGGKGGLRVIPVLFQKVYTVWVPRDAGGGFLGSYSDAELSKPIFVPPIGAEYPTDAARQVVETAQWWALIESTDGTWSPAIIPMKSTQLKASRNWLSLATIASQKFGGAPMFVRCYRVFSVSQQNAKGTFFNYKVEDVGFADPALIKLAGEFYRAIKAGLVKADYAKAADAETEAEEETTAPAAARPGF